MKARSIALTAVALSSMSAAFADAPEQEPLEPQPVARAQASVADLANGMRELLRAVVPEIALPKIELQLPTMVGARR